MAIGSISGATPPVAQVSANQVNARRDSDGDFDGSKVGEVEEASAEQSQASSSDTVGTIIDTKA